MNGRNDKDVILTRLSLAINDYVKTCKGMAEKGNQIQEKHFNRIDDLVYELVFIAAMDERDYAIAWLRNAGYEASSNGNDERHQAMSNAAWALSDGAHLKKNKV